LITRYFTSNSTHYRAILFPLAGESKSLKLRK